MAIRRGGARAKPPVEGKRNQIGLRITADLKRRLDVEATRNGRTLADEVEWRLSLMFERQDLLGEVTTLAYGKQVSALLRIIGHALERLSAMNVGKTRSDLLDDRILSKDDWLEDHHPFVMAKETVDKILDALCPPDPYQALLGQELSSNEAIAEFMAARMLDLLNDPDQPRWQSIRADLGALAPTQSKEIVR